MKIKKILSLFLILTILLTLTGCDNPFSTDKKTTSSKSKPKSSEWPSGNITVICPWGIGGLADQVNREVCSFGETTCTYSITPKNIVGDGGSLALSQYLTEPANSNNLILAGEGNFAIPPLVAEQDYNYEDFVPVINLYSSTFVLLAHPSTRVTSFDLLKEYVKYHEIKVGTSGKVSSEALQAAALFHEIGVKAKIVPYESAYDALKAALSGEVNFTVTHSSLAKEFVRDDKIIPIVAFDNRKLIDEIYALDCVTDYGINIWMTNICAIFMRAGTDEKTIQKAYNKFKTILESRKFLTNVEDIDVKIDIMDGEEIERYIKSCKLKAEKYAHLLSY